MRAELEKAELSRRLKVVERIVPKKASLPMYYAAHMDVSDGVAMFTVANTKEVYTFGLDAAGWDGGSAMVPAAELVKAVQAAPSDKVWIIDEGGTVIEVRSGTARWSIDKLQTPLAEIGEFPTEAEGGTMSGAELYRLLDHVRYAASKSENRPSFMQVHVTEDGAIASDGRRVHSEGISGASSVPTFDVPERAVDTLSEALSAEGIEGTSEVLVSVSADGDMFFAYGGMQYTVGRLNYPYPNIEEIVLHGAREQSGQVIVSISALVTAIKVASVAIADGGSVTLRFTQGVIEVVGSGDRTEGRMEVRAGTLNIPSGHEVNVIASDLLELLGKVESEDGDVSFSVGVSETDPGWVYVNTEGAEAAIRPVVK